MTDTSTDRAMKITGKHVLFAMLAFFGVVIAVNGVFIHFAFDSWTGLTSRHAYTEGLAYNRTLERAAAQRALGWTSELSVVRQDSPLGTVEVAALARLAKSDGAPVAGGEAMLLFQHPIDEKLDLRVALAETAPGLYEVSTRLPAPGNWRLRLEMTAATGETFRRDEAIWIK